jgi:hypothetical protein
MRTGRGLLEPSADVEVEAERDAADVTRTTLDDRRG